MKNLKHILHNTNFGGMVGRTVYHITVHGIEARLTAVELCITQRCMGIEARLTAVELCITQRCME